MTIIKKYKKINQIGICTYLRSIITRKNYKNKSLYDIG